MEGKVFCEKCGSEMTPYKKGHTKEFIPYISDSGITKKDLLFISGSFLLHKNSENKDNIKKGIGIYGCRNLHSGVSAVKHIQVIYG